MELWFVVEVGRGEQVEVALDVAPESSIADVARLIAGHIGRDPSSVHSLHVARLARTVRADETVSEAGLRFGDRVSLTSMTAAPTPGLAARTGEAVCTASVVSGPSTGRRIPLGPGEYVVGRGADADIDIDDRSMSRRHVRIRVRRDGIDVVDAGSSNGTFIDGVAVVSERAVPLGTVIEAGHTLLRLDPFVPRSTPTAVNAGGLLQFNRPPRVGDPVERHVVEVAAPPARPNRNRLPIIGSLGPLVFGVPMIVLGTGITRTIGIISAVLSPVLAVLSHLEDRRSGMRAYKRARRVWIADLGSYEARLADAVHEEVTDRRHRSPDAAELIDRADHTRSNLWERRPGDPDFLDVALGWADQPSETAVVIAEGGDPELRRMASDRLEPRLRVVNAPVVVRLTEEPVLGLAGDPAVARGSMRWAVTQLVTLHSPRDVAVVAAVGDDEHEEWRWLTWLPHLRGDTHPLGGLRYARTRDEVAELIAQLRALAASRSGRESADASSGPMVVLIVSRAAPIARSTVSDLLAAARRVGMVVLWQEDDEMALPGECSVVATLTDAPTTLGLVRVVDGSRVGPCLVDQIGLDAAWEVALALAPVRDATAGGVRGQIPTAVSLVDLLGTGPSLTEEILDRWERRDGRLRAVIGASAAGPFEVDVRRDGPHALVGGTTGAGKSELLQTFIASLAMEHPASAVTFLLVDYKGGAAFKDAVGFPHTVGLVTDLDGHLVHRALVSLHAELRRREHVLRDHQCRDLLEMERRYPELAPPSLIVVVDEFATLAKELPEFVDGVVSVAQRGRSLGIHLVLATQRPAGAINDNIRANTNLRIALRMNDTADSQDVINAADAAMLPRTLAGRAFVRTGQAELDEVQIAFVGGHAVARRRAGVQESSVAGIVSGRVQRAARQAGPDDAPTDLEEIVVAARQAVQRRGLASPREPWVPPLPDVIALEELLPAPSEPSERPDAHRGDVVVLGSIDLPDEQRRDVAALDLSSAGSVAIFGATGSGKTTLLRTIAVSLARTASTDDVHVYGLDHAGRGLSVLGTLPHVGAVVAAEEVDRAQRLIRHLERTITERQERCAALGVSTLGELRRAEPGRSAPRIVLLLDGFGGFAAVYEKINYGEWIDRLATVVTDGRAMGVHVFLTADRRAVVPPAFTTAITDRIALRMTEDDEYGALGFDPRTSRGVTLPPGRGFIGPTLEFQVAIAGGDPSGEEQHRAIETLAAEVAATGGDSSVPRIGTLPRDVASDSLGVRGGLVALGLGDDELAPVHVDPADGGFVVAGPNRSGRSSTLRRLVLGARHLLPAEVVLFAPRRTPLLDLDVWSRVARGHASCDDLADELAESWSVRDESSPLTIVVVDDAGELSDSTAEAGLERVARRARDTNVWLCVAIESSQARRAYSGPVPELRRDRHGVLLRPDVDLDGDLLDATVPRVAPTWWVPGRGVFAAAGRSQVVQVGWDGALSEL